MRFVLVLMAAIGGAVTACALLPGQPDAALQPPALVDAYLMAHGMAYTYVRSPAANPQIVAQLEVLDAKAAAAVHALVRAQSSDAAGTADAVSALADLAARQPAVEQ